MRESLTRAKIAHKKFNLKDSGNVAVIFVNCRKANNIQNR